MTHVAEGGISTGTTGTTYGSSGSGPGQQAGASDRARDTAQTAKDQAAGVAQGAAEAGRSVAADAKEQAAGVAHEAAQQAKDLLGEARSQLTSQTRTGLGQLAGTVRQFGDQLGQMADAPEQGGIASDVVREIGTRVGAIAQHLEDSEPTDLLGDVRRFASRHPGTFLLLAGGAGLALGRLSRGLRDASHDADEAAGTPPRPLRTATSAPVTSAPVTSTSGLRRGEASTATYGVVGGTTGLAADDLGAEPVVPELGPEDSSYTSPAVAAAGTTWPSRTEDRP